MQLVFHYIGNFPASGNLSRFAVVHSTCIFSFSALENKIEVETVGRLISKALKEKIQVECTTANLLKLPEAGKLPL